MSASDSFQDLNVDAVTATSLMQLLGLGVFDLRDPARFNRFRDVIDFFKQFPEDTQNFLITKATLGKNVDKLNHVYEYSLLLASKINLDKEVENFTKETSVLNTFDPVILAEREKKGLELKTSQESLKNRIEVYEK